MDQFCQIYISVCFNQSLKALVIEWVQKIKEKRSQVQLELWAYKVFTSSLLPVHTTTF